MSTGCQKATNTDRQEEHQADRMTELAGQLKSPLLFSITVMVVTGTLLLIVIVTDHSYSHIVL